MCSAWLAYNAPHTARRGAGPVLTHNRELYNLQSDPYGATNLLLSATAVTYTGTVNALLAKIAEFQK